jgi:ketosteroid isomerase-like protein
MSQQNVEVVQKAVDALNRQDADAFVASAHPDVEWEATDDRFPGFRALYRGRTGVRRWFEEAVEPWESIHNQIEEVTEVADDRVLLDLLMTTRGGTSGVETTLHLWQALWFKDGLVVRRQGPYWTRADAVEAMGPRESPENVEVVREAVNALNAGSRERLFRVFHPEAEFHSFAEQKVYRGFAGLMEYRQDVNATLDDFRTEEDRFLDGDQGRVVHLYRVVARGHGSGAPVSQEMGAVHQLRDGKILRVDTYLDQRDALEAAGLREWAVSQKNLEVVRELISAVNDRDLDRYLAHCTESIQLETPWAPVEGVYEGPEAMRRFFSDLRDTLPDFQLVIERLEPVGADRILALLRASATGRASGITAGADALGAAGGDMRTATVYDLADGRVRRIRVFLDRQEAFEALGLHE